MNVTTESFCPKPKPNTPHPPYVAAAATGSSVTEVIMDLICFWSVHQTGLEYEMNVRGIINCVHLNGRTRRRVSPAQRASNPCGRQAGNFSTLPFSTDY